MTRSAAELRAALAATASLPPGLRARTLRLSDAAIEAVTAMLEGPPPLTAAAAHAALAASLAPLTFDQVRCIARLLQRPRDRRPVLRDHPGLPVATLTALPARLRWQLDELGSDERAKVLAAHPGTPRW